MHILTVIANWIGQYIWEIAVLALAVLNFIQLLNVRKLKGLLS